MISLEGFTKSRSRTKVPDIVRGHMNVLVKGGLTALALKNISAVMLQVIRPTRLSSQKLDRLRRNVHGKSMTIGWKKTDPENFGKSLQ